VGNSQQVYLEIWGASEPIFGQYLQTELIEYKKDVFFLLDNLAQV